MEKTFAMAELADVMAAESSNQTVFPWSLQDLREAVRCISGPNVREIRDHAVEMARLKLRVEQLTASRDALADQLSERIGNDLQQRFGGPFETWQEMPGDIHPCQGTCVFALFGQYNEPVLAWYQSETWFMRRHGANNICTTIDSCIKWYRKISPAAQKPVTSH